MPPPEIDLLDEPGPWGYVVLTPQRVPGYRGYGELAGGTIMREGRWPA